jgi:hypothetical protein
VERCGTFVLSVSTFLPPGARQTRLLELQTSGLEIWGEPCGSYSQLHHPGVCTKTNVPMRHLRSACVDTRDPFCLLVAVQIYLCNSSIAFLLIRYYTHCTYFDNCLFLVSVQIAAKLDLIRNKLDLIRLS